MNRRNFLRTAAGAALVACSERRALGAKPKTGRELAGKLPRWRGFNLQEKFNSGRNGPFLESDFALIQGWGFDFVRLPMDYRCWTDKDDPYAYNEKVLKEIDQAVEFGRTHGIHVSLNLHRAPGYTVARPPEKLNLWKDEEAQKQFDAQWAMFAKRYEGIPSERLSLDLVNEPAKVSGADYAKVARRATAAIRNVDPDRLVISDGNSYGNVPVFELADLGIAQSTRGYQPFQLTHYKASWAGGNWAEPTWPLKRGKEVQGKEWLRTKYIEPWKRLEAMGVGVHVGEWGVYNRTPHDVVLRWMRDVLTLWREAGWGWAVWNLRGGFGPLDSKRQDVTYESFRGHQLDRKMLELLRRS